MKSNGTRVGVGILVAFCALGACVTVSTQHSGPSRPNILRETADLVIVPGYRTFENEAGALDQAIMSFCAGPSQELLLAARSAFEEANHAWAATASFRLGPAADAGNIQRLPARFETVEQSATSSEPVSDTWIRALGAYSRGLPAIEYLLFAYSNEEDALARLEGTRRCEYLAAAARDLAAQASILADAWDPGHADELAMAGQGSASYPTQADALNKLVTQMLAALELIKISRLGGALGLDDGTPDPSLVESPHADDSVAAMVATLEGLRRLWVAEGARDSFAIWVRERNPELASEVLRQIDDALSKVRVIPEPFDEYVLSSDHRAGEEANLAVRTLERTLGTDVAQSIAVSVGFTDNDGD